MTYDIGYRRPPASGRFKPGTSGNPKGRPKGTRNFVTLLQQELQQTITVNENGKKKKVTRQQAMVKRVVTNALNGDARAILLLIDILKRTGHFDAQDAEDLLPDDYEAILDSYVRKRQSGDGSGG
jgi:replication-associated recombination protein RarA